MVGDDVGLTLNGNRLAYRVSQIGDMPANWENQALTDVSEDDLVMVVTAGATRLVVWAVPAWR